MNKKIIAIIVLILVIAIAIAIFFVLNKNEQNNENIQNTIQPSNINQEANNNEEEGGKEMSNSGKALVIYFSQSGNTQTVANIIHNEVGGDIIELETQQNYPSNYDELTDYAQEEKRNNERPALETKIENIEEYDVIFLGYPNWWADMPMAIYSFLDEYDLSGKTIAPFITHGGSGLSGTPNRIRQEEANATVTEGLAINGSSASSSQQTVKNWITSIGFLE